MNILITRSSSNQTVGGAELSARDQCRVLSNLGHSPVMMTNVKKIRADLKNKHIQSAPGLYLQNFKPPLRYFTFWLLFPIKIIWDLYIVLKTKPDIINPHGREDQISLTLTKPIHNKPVAWKDPGDMIFILNQKHGLVGRLYFNLYINMAKKADYIYTLNEDHALAIDNIVNVQKKYTHISAIPSSILYEDYRPKKDSKSGKIIFGSTCRLSKEKDVKTLVEAFQIVLENYKEPIELRIAGDGPEREALEDLASRTPAITFVGFQADVSHFLNEINIFIHPALEEGWGRSIKEAMYFKKPVIATRSGGAKIQITDKENGLLYKPGDKKELADLMLLLLHKPHYCKKIASNAKHKAKNDGDFVDIVKNDIIPIYLNLLNAS